ncbi:MAG: hypothetical protein LBD38_00525 [Streptococcaceae bacterium]|jgi:uncharacterized protein YycO|nr:hypothetical protein [Streptococcaceae bacterium]
MFRDGDILFQVGKNSAETSAIIDSTKSLTSDVSYSHVGIVKNDVVIEATENGVIGTPLPEFLTRSTNKLGKPLVSLARLNLPIAHMQQILQNIEKEIGKPYNFSFSNTTEAFYCSQLIVEHLVDESGEKIFKKIPMNFKDETGATPQYWVDLFKSMGKKIPYGELGSNPQQLMETPVWAERLQLFID